MKKTIKYFFVRLWHYQIWGSRTLRFYGLGKYAKPGDVMRLSSGQEMRNLGNRRYQLLPFTPTATRYEPPRESVEDKPYDQRPQSYRERGTPGPDGIPGPTGLDYWSEYDAARSQRPTHPRPGIPSTRSPDLSVGSVSRTKLSDRASTPPARKSEDAADGSRLARGYLSVPDSSLGFSGWPESPSAPSESGCSFGGGHSGGAGAEGSWGTDTTSDSGSSYSGSGSSDSGASDSGSYFDSGSSYDSGSDYSSSSD